MSEVGVSGVQWVCHRCAGGGGVIGVLGACHRCAGCVTGVLGLSQVCWRCHRCAGGVSRVCWGCHSCTGGVEVVAQDKPSEETIIPAQNFEPSTMLAVSLKGLSAPLTSWWSLLSAMGPYRKQQMDTVMPTSLPAILLSSDVVHMNALEALPQTHCNIA